ncbi:MULTISPECIES: peptidase inhibitor family I36 protein [unclassified Amycolatopsis]|uniref:peptidase inhibitor family I36 protein n=1 Tax=unclassified Amycolatopsis TaxID=2618356 RepID=UPI001FF1E6AF|nr:peptidase inhibitor family I36 protein [Amycolatopsis sp. FBCC-B4732]UOX93118.1 peptidase inhibitor family I36 protein [Amycolatopsis sp. FBCC-B4732]
MRAAAVVAAVAVAATVGVGAAGPAEAACQAQYACMYSNSDLGGYKFENFNSQANWGSLRYAGTSIPLWAGDGTYNNVSSMENKDTNSPIAVYYNSQYRGSCFTIRSSGTVRNFANVRLSGDNHDGWVANDVMNSHHFNIACGTYYG